MALCAGCGRHLAGLDEGEFCRVCSGALNIRDYFFDYEHYESEEDEEEKECKTHS
uniref:Uncharacterized protein n=1 Tax=viral metagenome TaxID=1070528 RepID=A0A6M3K0M9_9ZZZZ